MLGKLSTVNEKVYFFLLLFVAFLIPTAEGLPLKLASLSVILLSAHWLVSGNYRQKLDRLRTNKLLWLFTGLFLINLVGLLRLNNVDEVGDLLVRKLPLLLFPLVIGTSARLSRKQVDHLIIAFTLGLFLISLFTFREGIAVLLDRNDLTTMVRLTLLHRPYAGMFSVFAIIGLFRLFSAYSSLAIRVILILTILYFIFFIYILYVKMTVIALLVLAVMFALLGAVKKLGKLPVLAAGVLLLLSASWYISRDEQARVIFEKITSFEDFSYQEYNIHLVSSINIRFINWGCSVKVLQEDNNWITGLGIGNTQEKLNQCYKDLNPWIYENQMNAHNEYLEETLRNGVVGLLMLLLCIAVPLVLSLRYENYTYLGFLALFAICCITENVLSRQAGIMFYAFFNSVFAFNCLRLAGKRGEEPVHGTLQCNHSG
jgi:O-antigen ligase